VVAKNQITGIDYKVVRPTTQTIFMLGWHIVEGVVVIHETIQALHMKKMDGVLLKLDFEKQYDKIKYHFLQ
jgi:hypothetical protein